MTRVEKDNVHYTIFWSTKMFEADNTERDNIKVEL